MIVSIGLPLLTFITFHYQDVNGFFGDDNSVMNILLITILLPYSLLVMNYSFPKSNLSYITAPQKVAHYIT